MYSIREVRQEDNPHIALIIRTVMPEFDCVGEGYSINDPEVDTMFEAFSGDDREFYVITRDIDDKILGCAGFAPLAGSDHPEICELQKMYFYTELRGKGMGQKLLERCINAARAHGYQKIYLETVKAMTQAAKLYKKMGFEYIPKQLGNTGHSGCDSFMIRPL